MYKHSWGSLRIYLTKNKKIKINQKVKNLLKEEEKRKFGIKKFKTYQDFEKKFIKLEKMSLKILKNLKKKIN